MKKYFSVLSQKFSWYTWVLIALLCVGIFLRTYNFHDFLRFNADQSRDAGIASDVIDGKESLPLLGPKAGGTEFRVGPAFYYFQIASAEVFGNTPDKMAYPDLLFSILAIPLLFFFLRKYFDMKTALALTAIFVVSAYAIKYSRFAWNPNSLPFWSLLFLYSLHEIIIARENAWKWWAVATGVTLGTGVQLHSLSLLLFPVMALGVFGYLLYQKRKNVWKIVFVSCFVALSLNIPQIASEIKTGGENTGAFLKSIETKEKKGSGLVANIEKTIVCFSQSSTYILSSYDSSDTCESKTITRGYGLPAFASGLILFVGGFFLTLRSYRKETEYVKKAFLCIVICFTGLTFLLLIPLANEISMRFFLITLFVPFVFLGIWLKYIRGVFPRVGSALAWSIVAILVGMNVASVEKTFATYESYLADSTAGMDNVLLKEVELSSAFIIAHTPDAKVVAVDGDAKYLFKALKSMQYFTSRSGIKLIQKKKSTDPSVPVFLIENSKNRDKILSRQTNVGEYLTFGRFTIFSLKP